MSDREYLSCAETAKLVRAALRRAFPRVKFSVRSDSYSGGASIDIRWTDGPSRREVEAIAHAYSGADFDGMIDLKHYREHVLMPDGSVVLAHDPGTESSRGSHPEIKGPGELAEIVAGARRVHFGADFIHCHRDLSEVARAAVEDYIRRHGQEEEPAQVRGCVGMWGVPYGGRWWSGYWSDVVYQLGEQLADPQAREAEAADRRENPPGATRAYSPGVS